MNSSRFLQGLLCAGLFSFAFAGPAAADWDHRRDDDRRGHRHGHGHFHDHDSRWDNDDRRWSFSGPNWDGEFGEWLQSLSYGWIAGVLSVVGAGLGVLWRLVRLVRELFGKPVMQ
ncbi:MAG: hypothetical protein AAF585_07505 [Verrucomicrobiota bacterium]